MVTVPAHSYHTTLQSQAMPSVAQNKRRKMRLKDWIIEKLNSNSYPANINWVDKSRKLFKISWLHASTETWSEDQHAILFRDWSMHTGKYGPSNEAPKKWKANFRCALNSLHDIRCVERMSIKRGKQAFKVFQFLDCNEKKRRSDPEKKRKSDTEKTRKSNKGSKTSQRRTSAATNKSAAPKMATDHFQGSTSANVKQLTNHCVDAGYVPPLAPGPKAVAGLPAVTELKTVTKRSAVTKRAAVTKPTDVTGFGHTGKAFSGGLAGHGSSGKFSSAPAQPHGQQHSPLAAVRPQCAPSLTPQQDIQSLYSTLQPQGSPTSLHIHRETPASLQQVSPPLTQHITPGSPVTFPQGQQAQGAAPGSSFSPVSTQQDTQWPHTSSPVQGPQRGPPSSPLFPLQTQWSPSPPPTQALISASSRSPPFSPASAWLPSQVPRLDTPSSFSHPSALFQPPATSLQTSQEVPSQLTVSIPASSANSADYDVLTRNEELGFMCPSFYQNAAPSPFQIKHEIPDIPLRLQEVSSEHSIGSLAKSEDLMDNIIDIAYHLHEDYNYYKQAHLLSTSAPRENNLANLQGSAYLTGPFEKSYTQLN